MTINENERRKCMECKHFKRGMDGLKGAIFGRCKLRDIVGAKRLGSVTACILFAEREEENEDLHKQSDNRT